MSKNNKRSDANHVLIEGIVSDQYFRDVHGNPTGFLNVRHYRATVRGDELFEEEFTIVVTVKGKLAQKLCGVDLSGTSARILGRVDKINDMQLGISAEYVMYKDGSSVEYARLEEGGSEDLPSRDRHDEFMDAAKENEQ